VILPFTLLIQPVSVNYGTWDEITLATASENATISQSPISYVDQDGNFDFTLAAGGLGTSLDGTNFKKLLNNKNGTYMININEDGGSMNGRYILKAIGREATLAAGINQEIAYTSFGNDVTSTITAYDTDRTVAGVTLEDVTVVWEIAEKTNITKQSVYILPVGTALNTSIHTAVGTFNNNTAKNWTGTTNLDSANLSLSAGSYTVYVVAEDENNLVLNELSVNLNLTAE